MPKPTAIRRNPWVWVPSLYLAEGFPYVVVMTVAVVLYKGLGISNTDIALYTSWLYLPWVVKPLWSPVVDILKTRRAWIWVMQLIIGAGLAGVALTLPAARGFQYSLAFFWLLAFSSATHDIAIDGFYLLATTEREQSFFVGIRSTFYRVSTLFGQGVLVMLAGAIQDQTGLPKIAIHASAKPGAALVRTIEPTTTFAAPAGGDLRILVSSDSVEIAPQARANGEVRALIGLARSNNLHYGFYQAERAAEKSAASLWTRDVSDPLAAFLRAHFGRETTIAGKEAGNVGLVFLRLSAPPAQPVVVTLGSHPDLGFGGGDNKSFTVAEGARLVFTATNWKQPAIGIIQLDPKLRRAAATDIEARAGNLPLAWSIAFFILTGMFLAFGIYHWLILPHPAADRPGDAHSVVAFLGEFFHTFGAFFQKPGIGRLLAFLLLYRFAESQLVKMVAPFLLDGREAGGLGLTTGQLGFAYGTVGIVALTCGGLLGGMLASRNGLKFWLWWMVLAIHLPDAVFVYLAYALPDNFWVINLCVAVEQFGYGFGFTAYMLYMIYVARGTHQTAHYAICTGFMALGMMIPGMFSGWLEDAIGYRHFFVWVLLATIPGFAVVKFIPLEPEFGRAAGK